MEFGQPPWNFSWVDADGNKLACMSWPDTESNLNYLVHSNIGHLVTLSPEMVPPNRNYPNLEWTLIAVEEFEPPTLEDMVKFIEICEDTFANNKAVGVHCRMGRGRTGVMAAIYLVHFEGLSPDRAITNLRLRRPGSVETREQERAVHMYHDFIRTK